MYAGRRARVTEVNRHTGGNTQIAAPLFGHTPEGDAKHYERELPDATWNAALMLDSAVPEIIKLRDESSADSLQVVTK